MTGPDRSVRNYHVPHLDVPFMRRETKREPAWVSAIRLAFLRGQVDVDGVIEEANLIPGYERTVRDVLSTMADRNLLEPVPGAEDRYVPDVVLIESE